MFMFWFSELCLKCLKLIMRHSSCLHEIWKKSYCLLINLPKRKYFMLIVIKWHYFTQILRTRYTFVIYCFLIKKINKKGEVFLWMSYFHHFIYQKSHWYGKVKWPILYVNVNKKWNKILTTFCKLHFSNNCETFSEA